MYQAGELITPIIADDGIGIDPVITTQPSDSLGLKLMKGLSQDISGNFGITNDKGTRINVTFNVDPLNGSNNLLTKIQEREVHT